MINRMIQGNALNVLKTLPAESVNCCVCSPPYWSLRDYGIEPVIWDGDKNCNHEFNEYDSKLLHENRQNLDGGTLGNPEYRKNLHGFGSAKAGFCLKCGAWRGSLGLEPTFELYIKHLCDIFDEVKRVLRKDGTCWVNIGDSYWGSGQGGADYGGKEIVPESNFGHVAKGKNYLNKSLCDIPYRFSIEMTNRGWIKRNTIIWYKKNCMPSSANNRFTIDFEYLFFFTKNNKAIFWTNEKTLECVSKKPSGTKGIEGKDWEWRECPNCKGTGKVKVNIKDRPEIYGKNDPAGMRRGRMRDFLDKKKDMYQAGNKPCKRCKGLGKIKYSFWTGHDYWFEQQFEPILTDSIKRELRGNRPNKYSKDKHLPKGVHPNTMSQVREYQGYDNLEEEILNRAGRNKRCVWIIPTQPFPEAHFAVYPEGLIEIPIKAGCPEFVCKKCGMARVKIYEKGDLKRSGKGHISYGYKGNSKHQKVEKSKVSSWSQNFVKDNLIPGMAYEQKFIGYSDCGCNASFESGIVLDPFMGAGTSALVALKQRKRFIGIEIKQEYIEMAKRRIAKVQQEIF